MKILSRLLFFTVLSFTVLYSQTPEDHLFRAAMASSSDSAKLSELNRLISANPSSKQAGEAYGARFSVLLSLHQDSAAFFSLHQYLAAKDTQSLTRTLQDVAMELGIRKKYPDSALVLVDSSVSMFKKRYGRVNPSLLYTKAWLLYLLKRYPDAESSQAEAIALLPPMSQFDPRYGDYFAQMGMIQMETKPGLYGVRQYVHAKFVSSQPMQQYSDLDSLVRAAVKDSLAAIRARDSLFEEVGREYFRHSNDTIRAKSFIAAQFSRNRVLPERARQLAREAYQSAQGSAIDSRSDAAFSLGIVAYSRGEYSDAEKFLNEAALTIPPYETELYLLLGSAQEKQGKKREALDTYLTGAAVGRQAVLMKPLQALQKELLPHSSLDSLITAAQRKLVDFFPEKYQRTESMEGLPNQRVVLAELFTGSECRPCQAADIAYNKLLDRYERSELVVVEYHLHIPRPDPMANADGESRSLFYGVNSTPTSIIDGTDVINTGGLGYSAKSKFAVYAEQVDHALAVPAQASVKISARIRRSKISFAVNASLTKVRKSARLRVLLVEDQIRYTGANGISEHRFVVRKMIRGAGGVFFTSKGRAAIRDAFSVSSVEDELEKYIAGYEAKVGHPGGVFKEKRSELDQNRLYLVAFVQDNSTRSILQSTILKVKR